MKSRAVFSLTLIMTSLATSAAGQIVAPRHYPPVGIANPFLPDSRSPGPDAWQEVGFLHRRISRAREGGLISRREARRLHREADAIAFHAWHYEAGGLSDSERTELANRARVVSDAVTVESGSARRTR